MNQPTMEQARMHSWTVTSADYGPTEPLGIVEAEDVSEALRLAYARWGASVVAPRHLAVGAQIDGESCPRCGHSVGSGEARVGGA
jgi:hypothetical protein